MGAHDAGKGVAVGDADGGKAEGSGFLGQLFGMRGTAQEREIGGDGKLGIRGHGKTPCTNHLGVSPAP